MFPACCFRPRIYVKQVLFNGVLNEILETRVSSVSIPLKCFVPHMFSEEGKKLETYIYKTLL